MAKHQFIACHQSSQRELWWHLLQEDDGQLYIEHQSGPPRGEVTKRRIPLHEFIATGGSPVMSELQSIIDKMFEKPNA